MKWRIERALREVRAKAWDEGAAFMRAAYDVSVPTRDALALVPQNPYREGTK